MIHKPVASKAYAATSPLVSAPATPPCCLSQRQPELPVSCVFAYTFKQVLILKYMQFPTLLFFPI